VLIVGKESGGWVVVVGAHQCFVDEEGFEEESGDDGGFGEDEESGVDEGDLDWAVEDAEEEGLAVELV